MTQFTGTDPKPPMRIVMDQETMRWVLAENERLRAENEKLQEGVRELEWVLDGLRK